MPHLNEDPAILTSRRRTKRNRLFSLFIVLIIVGSLVVRYFMVKGQGPHLNPFQDPLAYVFILEWFNFVLILVLFMLIARDLVKLFLQWFRKRSGAYFRIKIVSIFIILVTIPIILTTYVSFQMVQTSINKWFSVDLGKALEYATMVSDDLLDARKSSLRVASGQLVSLLKHPGFGAQGLAAYLKQQARDTQDAPYNGIRLELLGQALYDDMAETDIHTLFQRFDDPRKALVQRIVTQGENTYILQRTVVRNNQGNAIGYLDMYARLSLTTSRHLDYLYQAKSQYEKQGILAQSIKNYYLLAVVLTSILILFMAIWFGIYFSNEITVPITHLIDATRRVAKGDLSLNIRRDTGEEIGMLIDSFNSMVREIKHNRDQLQQKNMEILHKSLLIELVVQNMSTGLLILGSDTRVVTANQALLRIFERTGLLQSLDELDAVGGFTAIRSLIARTLSRNANQTYRRFVLQVKGYQKTVRASTLILRPADAAGDKDIRILVMVEDISDIIKAEQLTTWREIARRIAHEIKNPLTPLQLAVQRMSRKIERDAALAENRTFFNDNKYVMLESIKTIESLVDRFRRFTYLSQLHQRPDHLEQLLESIYTYYKNQDLAIALRLDIAPGMPGLRFDRMALRRAVINLMDNAIEALAGIPEPCISLSLRHKPASQLVVMEIADNGPGLSAEEKNNLFLPYFSTKSGGTGLGLAIVQNIIFEHRGTIRVRDNTPRGCIFHIELPVDA